jgi:sigma-B regulation protein RsbU (phosphoserine phosphatase)
MNNEELAISNQKLARNNKCNILVVDDTPANLRLLTGILSEQGYKVRPACDGFQALSTTQSVSLDLILLDINMPEMDGYEVCSKLKANARTHNIPVIFISALSDVLDKVKAFGVGGVDYITKPFQVEEVLARVETHLALQRLQNSLRDKNEELAKTLQQLQAAQEKLTLANQEISALNEKLKEENLRMRAELEVTKQLQQMILPKPEELESIEELEIAGYMEPADEVGGDYYDVLQRDGKVKIGIGDVTGHGLESGVLMLMTQTAVRTLQESNQTDPVQFLDILNRTLYGNVQRINPDKNLTLALLDYHNGTLSLSGQHEEIIVVRAGGEVERIDTIDLGFPIGLDEEIADFIASEKMQLNAGDVVVLYTDGITEAMDMNRKQYGIERLCAVAQQNCDRTAREIKQAVIEDVRRHIGTQKVYDDITLVVLKQK